MQPQTSRTADPTSHEKSSAQFPPTDLPPVKPIDPQPHEGYASTELAQLTDTEVDKELDLRRQEELARLGRLAAYD